MKWLELHLDTQPAGIEPGTELLSEYGIDSLMIDEEGDFKDFLKNNHQYWDYVDEALLDSAGKLHLEKAGLLAYAHGDYYALGKQLGKFGWSVRRKKPGGRKPGAQRGKDAPGANPRRPQK